MSSKYGGETTLNELRVMNQCYFDYSAGNRSRVSTLSIGLGIPKSTVSRAVSNLEGNGWLSVQVDANDRRVRLITLGKVALDRRSSDWQDCINWINESSE